MTVYSDMRYRAEPFVFPAPPVLSASEQTSISQYREAVASIVRNQDPRLLLILGPCSVHHLDAFLDYALRVQRLADQVSDVFFCVLRTYVEKPRSCLDWRGLLHDPRCDGSNNFFEGIYQTQSLMQQVCARNIPIAAELLDPCCIPCYLPFLSWGCIGARTVTSPVHRYIASGAPCPMGFKNSIDGNVDVAIQAAIVAEQNHTFLWPQADGQVYRIHTEGNPDTHLVLRGGRAGPNYMSQVVERVHRQQSAQGLNRRLCIDCAHDNSGKDPRKQPDVFNQVIEQVCEGAEWIGGIMLESFLHFGQQTMQEQRYGVSVTDGCLGWEATEQLILSAHARLGRHLYSRSLASQA